MVLCAIIVKSFCVSNGSASDLRQFPVSYLAIHGNQFEDRTLLCAKTTKFAPYEAGIHPRGEIRPPPGGIDCLYPPGGIDCLYCATGEVLI